MIEDDKGGELQVIAVCYVVFAQAYAINNKTI
jgi:hypothetical protein